MILSKNNQEIFFKNYLPLLYCAGVYEGIVPQTYQLDDFIESPIEILTSSRDVLFNDRDVVKNFVADNRHQLDSGGLQFAANVSKGLLADFVLLKQTDQFAVLMEFESLKFYEVISVTQPLSEMVDLLPLHINTAIFDFDSKIVCDGLIRSSSMHIRPNSTKVYLEDYSVAVKNKKVIQLLNMDQRSRA